MSANIFAQRKLVVMAACCLTPLLAVLTALRHLHAGWDDGAITVAFASTFHRTGHIALTPISEQVEGTSSLLWMLVLSLGATFSHSPDFMLALSKAAAGVAFALALCAFALLSKHFLPSWWATLALLLFALSEVPFVETRNGMEMNFYVLLTLLLTLTLREAHQPRQRRFVPFLWCGAALLVFAILLVRPEAPYLLFFLYLGVWLTYRRSQTIALLAGGSVLLLALIEAWRVHRFHSWLPNTILAKRFAPYTPVHLRDRLSNRIDATTEVLIVLAAPIFFAAALWLVSKLRAQANGRWVEPVLLTMTVGALGEGALLGQNWGHPGRMILAFLPFLLLALVSAIREFGRVLSLDARRIGMALVICQFLLWQYRIRQGGDESVSYATVEQTGLVADTVRRTLHRDTLSAFVPDVGASALCCERLAILDSALLANAALAQSGYAATPEYLRRNQPDVIETHSPWSREGRLYTSHLLDNYGLVQVLGKYAFVRNDLYAELKHTEGTRILASCVTPAAATPIRGEDLYFLMTRAECVSLDAPTIVR